jgi:PhnB protein
MHFTPYLNFDGQCKEAFTFYQKVLGGTLEVMTHGESPIAGEVSPDWNDLVMHARLDTGESAILGSDAPLGEHEPARGIYVTLHVSEPAEAERIFHALAEGGNVTVPLEKNFWAERFGMLTDRYGTPWMVNCAITG